MRGRPANQMTRRRRQVLDQYETAAKSGEPISMARLARQCGLYDFRDARRIVGELRKMGALA